MQFTVEIQAEHLERVLQAAARDIATPSEMLGSIGESLFRVNQERHDQGIAPDGTAWKALAESTKAAGPRKGGPLKKTGRMLQSFNYQVSGDALRLGFDGARDGMLAGIHNAGSEPYLIKPLKKQALAFNGRVVKQVNHPGIPKRELVGFPVSDQELVSEVLADHLINVIRNA